MGLKMRLAECHKAAHTHTHTHPTPLGSRCFHRTHKHTQTCAQTHRRLKKKLSVPALRRADVHTRTHKLASTDPDGQTQARTQ